MADSLAAATELRRGSTIYEIPSLYKEVIRTEPFTQLKRVELENIMHGYRDKLDEQRAKAVPQ